MSKQTTLGDWLSQEPFGLAMSSGFFGFFAHTGVLLALEEAGLQPVRLSGSSAGALATGLWGAGLSATELRDTLLRLQRRDFWDPSLGAGLLRGGRFRAMLESLLPHNDFAHCRMPLAISVFDVLSRKTTVVASGELASAIQASCSVPLLFQPVWREGRPLLDGGIADRPGLAGMPEQTRVLHHHIASRSPWRSARSIMPPERNGLVSLAMEGLPRSGPFRLEAGRLALEQAHTAMRRALEKPVAPLLLVPAS
jgi:NTE family protein